MPVIIDEVRLDGEDVAPGDPVAPLPAGRADMRSPAHRAELDRSQRIAHRRRARVEAD
jgi:hypothetical protein